MTHLITLQQIRDKHPDQSSWDKLLSSLGNPSDLSMEVSFGDIAKSCGSRFAIVCLDCVDDRRFAISLVLPAVKRASEHTKDKRVHECIYLLDRVVSGEMVRKKDLKAAASAASDACDDANHDAPAYAAIAAYAAAISDYEGAVAVGVPVGSYIAEFQQQAQDIISISPLHALAEGKQ